MEKATPAHTPKTAKHHTASHKPVAYISNPLELIRPSLEAFKLSWLNIVLIFLALVGISIAIFVAFAVLNFANFPTTVKGVMNLIIFVGGLPLTLFLIGYFGYALNKTTIEAARGHKLSFSESLPYKPSLAWPYVWTSLLAGLAILGGLILFVVPGFIFMAWFANATYIMVDKGISGREALKRSRELARGRNWEMLGTLFLGQCVTVLALIPFVGWLAALVLGLILIPVIAVRYNLLTKLKKEPGYESVPTHPLNYAVLVVGLIVGGMNANANYQKALVELDHQSQLENNLKAY